MRSKPCLTASDARIIAAACRALAERNNWAVTIAVVDDGGHLMHLERLDAKVTTVNVAAGKARTSALLHAPSAGLAARIKDEPNLLALDVMPLRGGVPIMVGKECVGGVGVSGVIPEQDEQVAKAGIAALLGEQS